jgi:hypothetical protein
MEGHDQQKSDLGTKTPMDEGQKTPVTEEQRHPAEVPHSHTTFVSMPIRQRSPPKINKNKKPHAAVPYSGGSNAVIGNETSDIKRQTMGGKPLANDLGIWNQ